MKDGMDEQSELVEAWLDGRIEGADALELGRRLAEDGELAAELELAGRIQAALRRSFVPPRDPGAALERLGLRARPRPRSVARRRVAVLLVGAAAILLLFRWIGGSRNAEPGPEGAAAGARAVAGLDERALAPVGPFQGEEPADGRAGEVARPDATALYEEALAWSDEARPMACGDELVAALDDTYGQRVALRPEAELVLHGPFASPEWPTGMILTAYPDEETAVLVAERDDTHRCCVLLQPPRERGLNVFTWRLGDLLLTEITPLPEPRLLDCFTER